MPRTCISRFHVITFYKSKQTLFLIKETLIFVKKIIDLKIDTIYDAFAPNSGVCFGQEF